MIITNSKLVQESESGFILSGKIYRDGGDEVVFEVPSAGKAVLVSHSLQATFLNAEGHDPVFYFSRDEVQGDVPLRGIENSISSEYRILRIMPVLTLKHNGREVYPLTLRGQGASDVGKWGCASGLVSSAIDIETIFATLNRETGLLVNGKVVVFKPSKDAAAPEMITQIANDAYNSKIKLADRVLELSVAFGQNSYCPTDVETRLNLPQRHDTVTFHGALSGNVDCVAIDNPAQRTLTLIFPYVADIPSRSILTPFNGQGYDGPSTLVTLEHLRKNPQGMQLIHGLHQLIHGR
jgi:hypothetical protein